jgi:lipopolysaccharide export system protein LptC
MRETLPLPQRASELIPRMPRRVLAGLRHSRRVARLRIALPVLAIMLIAALFIWPALSGRRIINLPSHISLPQLTMEQPRFTGTDEQNRPYQLQAARATQVAHELTQVDLVAPQASISAPDGTPLVGQATIGRFDQTRKRLWLGGDVVLDQTPAPTPSTTGQSTPTTATMRFTTSELFADLTARTIWGDKPAKVTGSFGSIEGQGFRIFDGGKVLLFTGASRAILTEAGGLMLPALTRDAQSSP